MALPGAQIATKFPAFRLKVILNTVIVATTAILLQQFLMDQADSMAYMTFDFSGFLGRIGNLFLYGVLPPAIFGTLIAFLYVTPLHKLIKKLHNGETPSARERRRAMRILVSYPYVLMALNMIGFGVGALLGTPANQVFTPQGLVIDFQNLVGGAVFANVQISINHLILAKPRAFLRLHHMDSDAREPGIAVRNMVVTLPLAIYTMLTLVAVGQSISRDDRLYATVYYSVAAQGKSLTEATDAYKAAVGKERQLPPSRIVFPTFRAKMQADFVGVFVGIFLFLCALAFFSQLFSSRVQVRQLGVLTRKLREIATGKSESPRPAAIGRFDDLGGLSEAVNLFGEKLRDLFAQFVESGQQVSHSSAILRSYLATTAAATKEMVASVAQIAAAVGDHSSLMKRSEESLSATLSSLDRISANLDSQTPSAGGTATGLLRREGHDNVVGEISTSLDPVVDSALDIRKMAEEQKSKSEAIQRTVESLVWIFSRVQEAAEEQTRSNKELAGAIESLQNVAKRNQVFVGRLRELLGSFMMEGAELEDTAGRG